MLDLFFVRHGETTLGPGIVAGSTDVELSAAGELGIARLRDDWGSNAPDRIMSSQLIRARHSAEILGKPWDLQVLGDARLAEMDFGEWEGKAWDDVCDTDAERFATWSSDWVNNPAPGGESLADVATRCASWLKEADERLDGQCVVVVAHAGTIRTMLCLCLGLPLENAMKFTIDYARVSRVTLSNQATRCLMVNADRVPAG